VAQLIELSLEEKQMSQKQLAIEIGVSPSRINDYVSGRAEPTLKIARLLCATLGITPAAMLGI
jgi:Predicted transcription factor, homolog of eukaryotic MBF1